MLALKKSITNQNYKMEKTLKSLALKNNEKHPFSFYGQVIIDFATVIRLGTIRHFKGILCKKKTY